MNLVSVIIDINMLLMSYELMLRVFLPSDNSELFNLCLIRIASIICFKCCKHESVFVQPRIHFYIIYIFIFYH